MEPTHSVQHTRSQSPQRLNRVLYSLIIASFFLPFATVRSCMGDEGEGTSYNGVELLMEDAGALLVGVILVAALLLVFSYRRRVFTAIQQGFLSATKALLCAIAILTTFFATGITFMFSRVSLQVGFYVCVGSWFLLHILHTRAALRYHAVLRHGCRKPPPPWGLVIGVMGVIVIATSAWVSEPNGLAELLLGIFAGLLLAFPIVILAMLFAVRYRLQQQETATEY